MHEAVGYCDRLHNLQAGFLLAKLPHLNEWNEARNVVARRYDELLSPVDGVTLLEVRSDVGHVYHLYVIQTSSRDKLQAHLTARGVSTGLHYPVPLHLQQAYADLGYRAGAFPVTERVASNGLSLPMYAELTDAQINHVVDSIKEFFV